MTGLYLPLAIRKAPPTPPKQSALAVLFKKVAAWVRRHWRELGGKLGRPPSPLSQPSRVE
jgi:hypothetical protein